MSQPSTLTTRRQHRDRGDTGNNAEEGKKRSNSAEKGEKEKPLPEPPATSVGPQAKIRTRLSTGTLIMNGTSTFKEKDLKSASSATESPKVQKDSPVSGSKRKASVPPSSSDTSSVIPPKKRKIGQNDGSGEGNQNDYFCWLCHKEDSNIYCELCPRVYHLRCLGVTTVPNEWVCPECEKTLRAECANTRSKAMTMISIDTLCLLLRYALDRMRQPGSEAFDKPVDQEVFPTYSDYIFYPMDFSTLEKNIKKKEYGCTEAFLADAKWILHNCIVFNGLHHKLTNVARNVIKSCKHEMSEIEVCPECYQNSCVKDASWFIEPCHPPHTLVWAKLKGYPFWPAKALQEVNSQVDVRFFGAHDRSWVPVSQVFLLSKESPVPVRNNKGGFAGAMEELELHIKNIREKFGTFVYPPQHTPYDKRHVYMNVKPKGSSVMATKRFKPAVLGKLASKTKESWSAERVSAVSKTASALKTKYSSWATKKSLAITHIHGQTAPHISSQDGGKPAPSDRPEPVEKTGEVSLSSATVIKVCQVSVTDVIQEKIAKIKELEADEEEEEGMEMECSGRKEIVKKKDRQNDQAEESEKEVCAQEEESSENRRKGCTEKLSAKEVTEKEESHNKCSDNEKGDERQTVAADSSGEGKWTVGSKTLCIAETPPAQIFSSQRKQSSSDGKSGQTKKSAEKILQIENKGTLQKDMSEAETKIEDSIIDSEYSSAEQLNISAESTVSSVEEMTSSGEGESAKSYKDSLTKTIEACKGKLGIVEVKDITDDDIAIESEMESDTEITVEAKASETEEERQKNDVPKAEGNSQSRNKMSGGEMDKEGSQFVEPTSSSSAAAPEVVSEMPNSSKSVCAISVNTLNSKSDVNDDFSRKEGSEKVSVQSLDRSSTASENDASDGKSMSTSSACADSNSFTAIKSAPSAVEPKPSSGSDKPISDSVKPDTDSGMRSVTDSCPGASEVKEASVQVSGKSPPVVKVSKSASDTSMVSDVSLKESQKDVTPSKPASDPYVAVEKAEAELVKSGADSSRTDATKPVTVSSHTEAGKSGSADTSALKPITIDDDDDNNDDDDDANGGKGNDDEEPSLLMEVETEAEHDQLIIDLDEDDLDLGPSGRGGSGGRRLGSGGFVRELAPSPSVIRGIQKAQEEVKRSELVTSSSVSSSSSSVLFPFSSSVLPQSRGDGGSAQYFRNNPFRMPVTHPESSAQTTSAQPASVAANASTVQQPEGSSEGETVLSPAVVKLVNKFGSEMQQKLAEMCREVMAAAQPDQDKSRCFQQEMDRLKWIHQQEIAEIKHNYKLTIAEMRATWEAEKSRSIHDLKKRVNNLIKEKDEAVMATKKKQWCAYCWKEAIYYCCWNTSYCSYHCQQQHWPTHMPNCTQAQTVTTAASTSTVTTTTATAPAGTSGELESDVMVMSANRSQGGSDRKAEEKDERIQAQKFNIPPPSSSAAVAVAGDAAWRNRMPLPQQPLGQNIHFMPLSNTQQAPQPPRPSQPLQQLQYLQSLGSGPALFQPNSQVQLLASRPGINTVLPPGTVMPPNAAVFPILRPSQQPTAPGSQNIMITRPMQYQQIWK